MLQLADCKSAGSVKKGDMMSRCKIFVFNANIER